MGSLGPALQIIRPGEAIFSTTGQIDHARLCDAITCTQKLPQQVKAFIKNKGKLGAQELSDVLYQWQEAVPRWRNTEQRPDIVAASQVLANAGVSVAALLAVGPVMRPLQCYPASAHFVYYHEPAQCGLSVAGAHGPHSA